MIKAENVKVCERSSGQLWLTVPKDSGFKEGDTVDIYPEGKAIHIKNISSVLKALITASDKAAQDLDKSIDQKIARALGGRKEDA